MKDTLPMLMIAGAILGTAISLLLTNDPLSATGYILRVFGGWICGMGGGMVLYVLLGCLRARGFFVPRL